MAKRINIDELTDGMVLAEPVLNKFGQTLLTSDTILNERHLNMLKTWNITSLMIKTEEQEELPLSDDIKHLSSQQILQRMKWIPRNSFEKDMFEMAMVLKAKQLLKNV